MAGLLVHALHAIVTALLHLGACAYAFNLLVGLSAQFRGAHYGRFHHWLYAFVFVTATAALVFAWHLGLLLTLLALAAMPLTNPRTIWHPTVAIIGALGYALAYAF